MFEKIAEKVKNAKQIIIFPHTNMDGDSVGCAKALYLAFTALGKDVLIVADEAVPENVSFLGGVEFIGYSKYIAELLELRYKAMSEDLINPSFTYDLAFAVDCSDESRIQNRMDVWNRAKDSVCIDHHPKGNDIANLTVRDSNAPAAATLVYKFLKESGFRITKEIAEAIYTGVLTDTGGFRYSNTDAETHCMIAELYSYGIDHAKICSAVYDNKPLQQLKLESFALKNTEFFCDDKLAISCIPYRLWSTLQIPYSYTESSIDTVRSIKGVEIAILFKEKAPDVYKVSMRAKNYANVQDIATKLGGGGHKKAAACTLEMPFEEAKAIILEECKAIL